VGGSPTATEAGSGGVAGGSLGGSAGVNAGGAAGSGVSGSGGHAGASSGAGGHADGGGGSGGSAGSGGGSAGSGGGSAHGGASGGCGKPVVRPSLTAQQQMSVGGAQRTYLLEVPQSVDNQTPLALVFALHGANMTNTQVVGSFNVGSLSKGQAITVYPQGDETASGARWTSNEANWSYIQMLMTDLESRYCVDPNRVFLTGFSMGGGFTMDTACQKSTMFRAFATVEGYGPGGVSAATQPTCANAAAKAPLLIIQGSTDGTVTPAMGQASLAFWTGKNGCSATTSMPMGMGFTSCTANEDCTSGFPVYYCTGTWMHAITSTAAADVWAFFSTFK
jgi:poly(3-hydroxybutyrate) depolymerase